MWSFQKYQFYLGTFMLIFEVKYLLRLFFKVDLKFYINLIGWY